MIRVIPIAATLFVLSAAQAPAETEHQLGPHQHGHGTLNLAVEGHIVQMELEVPGADIVGFEHAAETTEDQAKIEAAEKTLKQPLALFVLPSEAGCRVTSAKVSIIGGSESEHGAHEHDHHNQGEADEHESKDHEPDHSEFRAEYALLCPNVAAITTISFSYFDAFPNSEELEVTLITEKSQKAFEVNREHSLIDIRGMM